MINRIDILGASIVLSSYIWYFSLASFSATSFIFFAFILYSLGVAISMRGLSLHEPRGWITCYKIFAISIFLTAFLFLTLMEYIIAVLLACGIPVTVASLSLAIAYFTKNKISKKI